MMVVVMADVLVFLMAASSVYAMARKMVVLLVENSGK
jgi:hypothetical protein